jgi:hypothetical protein
MVLLEARGLWRYSIVRGGIGWIRRLACSKHGSDFSDGEFITAIEILSLCTSMPIYLVLVIKGVPWRG